MYSCTLMWAYMFIQLYYEAGHISRHRRSAPDDFSERLHQTRRRRSLQQIAVCARSKRIENLLVILVNRKGNAEQFGPTILKQANAFDTAHAGQANVHEHHLRHLIADSTEGLLHGPEAAGAAKA